MMNRWKSLGQFVHVHRTTRIWCVTVFHGDLVNDARKKGVSYVCK